ncbi:GNAT family N-acetyltransferase [Catellatospora sichuanensis]|uniref:GNAT family N-acetyltransferase n=1 Tax=Catellatospora sichuanensis TaxID=1969805 RepID=UPI0016423523|nr:GNAT family N-acetyltransferase [Catellatospora sichuanensis]
MTDADALFAPLAADAVPAVSRLAARCLSVDGGLPLAAGEGFTARRYAAEGGLAIGAYDPDGTLVAAAAIRPTGSTVTGTALVDPAARGRGLGAAALDWCLAGAEVVETESLTDAAAALFASRGLTLSFAEDVMRHDLKEIPDVAPPDGVRLVGWAPETVSRFHAAYRAAFAERPGFPDWDLDQWTGWLVDDDFRPPWSLLAVGPDGTDLGFVVCGDGWLVQVGTTPAARGQGVGAALTVAALRAAAADGSSEMLLDVNVNNPGAAALYHRLGFTALGRRARFARPS